MSKKTIGGHCERCGDLINKITGYEMLDRTYRDRGGGEIDQEIHFMFICFGCSLALNEWLSEYNGDYGWAELDAELDAETDSELSDWM
jgi:hypothetical protein